MSTKSTSPSRLCLLTESLSGKVHSTLGSAMSLWQALGFSLSEVSALAQNLEPACVLKGDDDDDCFYYYKK